MSGGGDRPHFTVNLNGGHGGLTEADVASLVTQFQSIVDVQLHKRMAEQGGYAYKMRYGLL
ncbi:phage HK97 tail length tape measure-like protein [Burkholderia pseudomallei]|nr:phage HK97 tail length tape measure-like protein [Burkholderia pseudomallei]